MNAAGTADLLVNLEPLAELLLLAAALALIPLAIWAWRSRGQSGLMRYRALVVLASFLTFDLIVFGSFTRLSDSGLGCPDWPGCYGSVSPWGAKEEISQAQAAMPTGPVTHTKAWIEMIHRYLAMTVGGLILWMCAWAWFLRRSGQPGVSIVWPLVTLVWVLVQGAFGAWTVTLKLYPAIVTMHLLLGLGLLALLMAQTCLPTAPRTKISPSLRVGLWLMAGALLVQIALGGWVSTNYAVLACRDFPSCQGQWWPPMDFEQGFAVFRHLGAAKEGGYLPFEALTAIHMAHRVGAVVVLSLMVALAAWLYRYAAMVTPPEGASEARSGLALRRAAMILWALAAWQVVSGVSNVVLGWPLLAALAHSAGAAACVAWLAWILSRTLSVSQPRN
jgi:cytochrome c oxidase assembly protein subunit 15